MIDFNGMSIYLGLFYNLRIENQIYCMFIFTSFVSLFLKSFFFICTGSYWIQIILNRFIWLMDGNPTGTATSSQIETKSNSNEWVLHTPQISRTRALPK